MYKEGQIPEMRKLNNFKIPNSRMLTFMIDKCFKNVKQREVRSEERKSTNINPRAGPSKNQQEKRPIMAEIPKEPNKKLYYLQFLSGQPVWGLVKNQKIDHLNESTNDQTSEGQNKNGNIFLIAQ